MTTKKYKYRDDQEDGLPLSRPPMFGSQDQANAWHDACRRAANTAAWRFTVAPRCAVHTPRGVVQAGEPLSRDDTFGRLSELVSRGVIIRNEGAPEWPGPAPEAA